MNELADRLRKVLRTRAPRVFGVGWAKTGTTTLGKCFEILGYNHQSQDLELVKHLRSGDLTPILEVARQKETFEDWPWLLLFKEFDRSFPGSRFVLTKRDPAKWLRSYRNMLRCQGEASKELNEIRRTLYGLPFPQVTDQQLRDRYEKHNREVEDYFKERAESLLVVDWEHGDGWEKLCPFLGAQVPAEPFPHANPGKYV